MYKICSRCVMDTTDPQIKFDKDGVCNHCHDFERRSKNALVKERTGNELIELAAVVKKEGEGKEYDCIIGLSGGVDSSYLAYLIVKEMGLRPLAVHLDNGWDSKLAVKNIENIVRRLKIDLHTHVIDWQEFKDIQIAYLKASVVDIEVISDHAIAAILYQLADETNVNNILLGRNRATEQIMPRAWCFNKNDITNLLDIHKTFGTVPIKTYPLLGLKKFREYKRKGIKEFDPLDMIDYHKENAKKVIEKELNWVDYGGKHYESIFTRFYQAYILPVKFHADKRRGHYSSLINSGQMTREQALKELKTPVYENEVIKNDYDYVIKKFGFTREEFEEIMNAPPDSHFKYKTDWWSKLNYKIVSPTNPIRKILRPR